MRLIHSSKKNIEKIFCAKTRVENEEQNKTKSEEIDETTKKDSSNQKTSKKIYVQTLQALDQIR